MRVWGSCSSPTTRTTPTWWATTSSSSSWAGGRRRVRSGQRDPDPGQVVGEVRGVVEPADRPALPGEDHLRQRGVATGQEGERRRPRGQREGLGDDPAVREDRDPLARVRGRDPLQRGTNPGGEGRRVVT